MSHIADKRRLERFQISRMFKTFIIERLENLQSNSIFLYDEEYRAFVNDMIALSREFDARHDIHNSLPDSI